MGKTKLLLDVVCDLRSLADSIQSVADAMTNPVKNDIPGSPAPATEKKPAENKVTLEQVRAVLAEKSRGGFSDAVRALLVKHGANKLSEIDPANYKALLDDVEVLNDAT